MALTWAAKIHIGRMLYRSVFMYAFAVHNHACLFVGEVASKTSLRLTRKSNIFMAGFPVKSLNEWQRTLVEAGFQLAVCTQTPPQ